MQEAHHDYNTLVHIEINRLQLHRFKEKVKVARAPGSTFKIKQ